jgi:predicted amidohydrolase
MEKTLAIATTQMDAAPAPTTDRLARAEILVQQACQQGAALVVLPELFNTGYAYNNELYRRAEPGDGLTVTWMQKIASHYKVHLAGTLLVEDQGEIFNRLVLASPKNFSWRYDKRFPWAWERAYFHEGGGPVIAETELGTIGFFICWDLAHLSLWKAYAGKVDLIVAASCPPDVSGAEFTAPGGERFGSERMASARRFLKSASQKAFQSIVSQQASWAGVPVVNSGACGVLDSGVPTGSAGYSLVFPALRKYTHLPKTEQMRMRCGYASSARIVDARGQVTASIDPSQGETLTLSVIELPEQSTASASTQPPSPLPWAAYALADVVLFRLSRQVYNHRKE